MGKCNGVLQYRSGEPSILAKIIPVDEWLGQFSRVDRPISGSATIFPKQKSGRAEYFQCSYCNGLRIMPRACFKNGLAYCRKQSLKG